MSEFNHTKRRESASRTTLVEHIAKPMGRSSENGPHLGDLRAFLAAAEDLPDETKVFIDKSPLSEGGRRDVTFRATRVEPIEVDR